MKNVGHTIRELRKKHGDRLEDLGNKVDYSYGGLAKIERGERNAGIELLHKIANAYEVSISYLLGEPISEEWLSFIEEMEKRELSPQDLKEIIAFLDDKFKK